MEIGSNQHPTTFCQRYIDDWFIIQTYVSSPDLNIAEHQAPRVQLCLDLTPPFAQRLFISDKSKLTAWLPAVTLGPPITCDCPFFHNYNHIIPGLFPVKLTKPRTSLLLPFSLLVTFMVTTSNKIFCTWHHKSEERFYWSIPIM